MTRTPRPTRCPGALALALAASLATGCAAQLTDRTPPSASYAPPINLQVFAADVTVGGRREIREVKLEAYGGIEPLAPTSGDRWETRLALPACDEVVSYRFVVEYDDASDTSPPYLRRIFPESGQFVRRIEDLPPECAGEPSVGTRAFEVDVTDDRVDATPGDGVCSTTEDPARRSSRCSLRAAVMEANATAGLNLIRLPAEHFVLTREGAEDEGVPNASVGDLDLTDTVVIEFSDPESCPDVPGFLDAETEPDPYGDRLADGGIPAIDGNGIDRVFDIYDAPGEAQVEVYMRCLHILGGAREGPRETGPIERGAGILNRAWLLMENVALTGHRLVGLSSQGAGVFNAGQLHVRDSALLHNQGADRGAVAGGTTGGAIYNACNGKSSIERSLLAFNRAARAPAIYNGGVSSFPCPATGSDLELPTVTITNSGVFKHFPNVELDAGGPLLAAIVNRGLLRISWSTLYQDEYDAISSSGRTELGNNLIWSRDLSGPTNTSCSGSGYASLGGNWVYGDGCGTGPSDRTGSIPGLVGQLVDVGGFSPTLEMNPPTSGSTGGHPVDATVTGLPFCPPSDQRDYRRPTDGNGDGTASCDVGAVEVRSSPRF